MREFKFRAWHNELGMSDVFCIDQGMFEAEPDVVMQYTGLKDKNGKEIFEGDIISTTYTEGRIGAKEGIYNYLVSWNAEECCYELKGNDGLLGRPCCHLRNSHSWEVIGNIYENPELLK